MYKIIYLVFLYSVVAYSQTTITPTEKYQQAGLVWGLLKYHHPEISKGTYDWDQELIELLDNLETIDNQDNLNIKLLAFIQRFNDSKNTYKSSPISITDERVFKKNLDYKWIDTIAFGDSLHQQLLRIKNNTNIGNYYATSERLSKMISFNNEKGIADFNPELKSHRLLTLFSFWNIIQYWNVNKYLTDTNWMTILEELTHDFINATTIDAYEMAKLKMFATLNDSHSYRISPHIFKSKFNHYPPFGVQIINDTLKVTAIHNKELANKNGIHLGDMIVNINDHSITDYIEQHYTTIFSTSNKTYLRKRLEGGAILLHNKDVLPVQILTKDGNLKKISIHLYKTYQTKKPEYLIKKTNTNWKAITSDITYINLAEITKKEFSKVFKNNHNDKAIILDLRNYPKHVDLSDFSKFLYPDKKEFIKILLPLKGHPSLGEYDAEAPLKLVKDPFSVGKRNNNYYKGQIILLVNRITGSMAEYFGMAIQQAPNCITIGEQTMGAVMNITAAKLPDQQEFYFTGIGAFYPNGEHVQRKGLRIDHYITESALQYNPNLYIEKAVQIIENKFYE